MKILIIAIGLSLCMACHGNKKTTRLENESAVETDSSVQENSPVAPVTKPTEQKPSREGEQTEEKDEIIFTSQGEYAFISDPFDFSLSDDVIKDLLGKEAKTKVKEFEAGEDYSAYTYSTTTYGDTEISYYSYPGKHSATITTPLLPLKKGIKIGMLKSEFLTAMNYGSSDASKATVYRLTDDYGSIDFSFRNDSLFHIRAFYEEGD